MRFFRWLVGLWGARQREADLLLLWPACKERAPDRFKAMEVFVIHTLMDPAWEGIGIRQVVDLLIDLEEWHDI